jgi:hypothetical protein
MHGPHLEQSLVCPVAAITILGQPILLLIVVAYLQLKNKACRTYVCDTTAKGVLQV